MTEVKQHDHEDNPLSADEIEKNLWLGNLTAACNLKFLKSKAITHILTIDSFPIQVCSDRSVVSKYVQIADMARENILEHFAECLSFIEEALSDPKNAVLVHCFYGVSRSATIVIAYLMKKYSIDYQRAYDR
jgi:dual specificity phosphatase 12